jgi:hypothetical protein
MGILKADVKSIFGHAMSLSSPGERAAYLQQACAGDAALRAEIESLLQADREAGSFLGERDTIAAVNRLKGVEGWEIVRIRLARHVNVARLDHRDANAYVGATATEVGGVAQLLAGGVQAGHESVMGTATPESGLEGVEGREVGRGRPPRHVGITGRIHGDAIRGVAVQVHVDDAIHGAATEVGGINQR